VEEAEKLGVDSGLGKIARPSPRHNDLKRKFGNKSLTLMTDDNLMDDLDKGTLTQIFFPIFFFNRRGR
jgi:hypothetical protein